MGGLDAIAAAAASPFAMCGRAGDPVEPTADASAAAAEGDGAGRDLVLKRCTHRIGRVPGACAGCEQGAEALRVGGQADLAEIQSSSALWSSQTSSRVDE